MDKPAFLFCNHDDSASVTATDTQAGLDVNDVLYATEDTFWKPLNTTGTKAVVVDRNVTTYFNTLSLLGISLDGVALEIRGSTDNFVASDDQLISGVIVSDINSAWISFSGGEYRYIKLNFTGFDTDFAVSFVCFSELVKLPYLEKDYDPDNMKATGKHMVSSSGMYIGFNLQKNMAEFDIVFGQVTEYEYNYFYNWRQNCIKTMNPFFFVPDVSEDAIYFGWLDNASFSAPLENGMRVMGNIKFVTRAN